MPAGHFYLALEIEMYIENVRVKNNQENFEEQPKVDDFFRYQELLLLKELQ